jgi:hypothetical protein
MWNPIHDITESWGSAASSWGKVSVAAYFSVCWFTILYNALGLVNPLKFEPYACGMKELHSHESVTAYVVFVLRLWELTVVFFFGLLIWNGWTLRSTGVLAAFWLALYLVHVPWYWAHNEYVDCIMAHPSVGYTLTAVVVIAISFKWIDDKIKARTSTPGETTPLNLGV